MRNAIEARKDHACLLIHGSDRSGLVAEIAAAVTRLGGNIVSLDQYSDNPEGGAFFQRVVFHRDGLSAALPEIRKEITESLKRFEVVWQITDRSKPKRMAILASKSDHCVLDLLWRWRRGELPVTIPMVISNHTDIAEDVRSFSVPFFHVPTNGKEKLHAETNIIELLEGNVDFIVLARYMQILSESFLKSVNVPIINIHHSFLPAFIGASPYKKAKERGVKLIGATSHYVTKDLDAGPIIEQDVTRAHHSMTAIDLQARGAYVEREVLSRAVRWHSEDQVIRNGTETIIFGR